MLSASVSESLLILCFNLRQRFFDKLNVAQKCSYFENNV